MLVIVDEMALVLDPKLVYVIPISIVERVIKTVRVFVVEHAEAPEPILFPLAIVGNLVIHIVENTLTRHFILLPLSGVFASLLVEKCPESMSKFPFFLSFIPPLAVVLSHKCQLW